IKFSATESSVFRLDDITLATGIGGDVIDLSGGGTEPGEATEISIPTIISMLTDVETVLDANADRFFTAVVQSDVAGGNYTNNNLVVATENATTAGNGIVLYGSQVDPKTLALSRGDKVKVTLLQGKAKIVNFKGVYEVTGAKEDTWATVEKVGTATITPIVIAPSSLKDYQGMTVTIKKATPSAAGIWGAGSSPYTFTASGQEFAVFCKSGATAFVDQPFALVESDITGLATVYTNAAQLAPRDMNDVKGFTPTAPTILNADPASLNFPSTGGSKETTLTIINQGANTISTSGLSGILSATVSGTKVTVTASANTTTKDVEQTLKVSLSNGNSIDIPVLVTAPASGSQTIISVDFTNADSYPSTFPKLTANKLIEALLFSFGGHDFTFAGSTGNGYYQAMNGTVPYLINGKQGAYIELPAVAGKRLTKVAATTLTGASKSVMVAVTDQSNAEVTGGTAIKWEQLDGQLDYTYSLSGTSVNTKYRIYIASAHNAQFAKLELTYE
ncbi:MAG: DUF5689 domain-containing protein, partial [Bacteroides xylanisolvens]